MTAGASSATQRCAAPPPRAGWTCCWASCCASARTGASHGQPWYAAAGSRHCGDPAGVPAPAPAPARRATRPACATRSASPSSRAPAPSSSTTWARVSGRKSTGHQGRGLRVEHARGPLRQQLHHQLRRAARGDDQPDFDYKHGTNDASSPFQTATRLPAVPSPPLGRGVRGRQRVLLQRLRLREGVQADALGRHGGGERFATGLGGSSAVTLRFGPSGAGQSLYYTTYANGGEVRRASTTPARANRPPVAVLSASPTTSSTPLTVNFNGGASSDPDGDTLTYVWSLGMAARRCRRPRPPRATSTPRAAPSRHRSPCGCARGHVGAGGHRPHRRGQHRARAHHHLAGHHPALPCGPTLV